MTFDQLRYFVAVAQSQNMTKAAEKLNIAQPALSRTIARLEEELEFKLFDRHGKTIFLNQNGEEFLRFARECLQAFERTKMNILSEHIKGSLKIGNMLENIQINRAIADFSKSYPEIQLEIVSVPNTVHPENFQFFFGTNAHGNAYGEESLESICLWKEEMCLMASKDHELAKKKEIALREAMEYPFVLPKDTEYANFIDQFFRLAKFHPKSYIKTNNQSMLVEMICNSDCVALTPMFCNLYGKEEQLQLIKLLEPKYTRQVHLYWSTMNEMTKTGKIFLEFMKGYSFFPQGVNTKET